MTVALLSNVTVTSLAMRLNKTLHQEVFSPGGYNTWLQEIARHNSNLYQNDPEIVFIVLHGRELLGDRGLRTPGEAENTLAPLIEAIDAARAAHENLTFVVSTLDIPQRKCLPLITKRTELHACAYWRSALEERAFPLVELAEIATEMGRGAFYNDRVWYMGALPFSKSGEEALSDEMHKIWRAIRGKRRKCLALDLDNTLWGGVIGEHEIDGIHLDTTGSGSRFYDFQKRIRDLKESGVLLAIITKNNREDALNGINNHPAMLLHERDFAAIRANWEPKPKNLLSIADELNIGTDSFVFIDDNPIEREKMLMALPEVAVPEFPEDTSQLEKFISGVAREYFLLFHMTGEDLDKTEQYRAEAERRKQRSAFDNLEGYLKSLEMVLSVEELKPDNLSRASQLTQKTNQFNLTTRRYSEAGMKAVLDDPMRLLLLGSLTDRFGDYGKIVLGAAKITGDEASVETFLMSCRVMDRGVEYAFLVQLERFLYKRGVRTIYAWYLPTARNVMVANFWGGAGYELSEKLENGGKRYRKTLSSPSTAPSATIQVRRSGR